MEKEGREEVRQAWMLPPPFCGRKLQESWTTSNSAGSKSRKLQEQPGVCAGYLTCTESFCSVKLSFCR